MARYVFPAVFTAEENGLYSVYFPDLEGCYTSGDDLGDAIAMAEDVLAMTLYTYEKENTPIPKASDPATIELQADEFVNYVTTDTLYYQRRYGSKAVKKTLSIPEWLNNLATAENLNFSQVLQEALATKLGVPM